FWFSFWLPRNSHIRGAIDAARQSRTQRARAVPQGHWHVLLDAGTECDCALSLPAAPGIPLRRARQIGNNDSEFVPEHRRENPFPYPPFWELLSSHSLIDQASASHALAWRRFLPGNKCIPQESCPDEPKCARGSECWSFSRLCSAFLATNVSA